jgi:hypothetical protein
MDSLGALAVWYLGLSALAYVGLGVARWVSGHEPWPRLHIWHLCGVVLVVALCLPFESWPAYLAVAVVIVVLTVMAADWLRQFVFLMGRADGDFPGRNDKLIWVVFVTALAGVGLHAFRVYRAAHWPVADVDAPRARHATAAAAAGPV